MKSIEEILKEVEEEVVLLTDTDDCFGIELGDNKGLFIQVINYGENLEYLIELNDIIDGSFEPCASMNYSSEFGNLEKLKETVIDYLNCFLVS